MVHVIVQSTAQFRILQGPGELEGLEEDWPIIPTGPLEHALMQVSRYRASVVLC